MVVGHHKGIATAGLRPLPGVLARPRCAETDLVGQQ